MAGRQKKYWTLNEIKYKTWEIKVRTKYDKTGRCSAKSSMIFSQIYAPHTKQ